MSTNSFAPDFDFQHYNIGVSPQGQAIIDAANQMLADGHAASDSSCMFIVKPANYWIEQASMRPVQQMLFGEFWFDNEICILFADTNLGKSILAVQIGNSISTGKPVPGFKLQAEAQKVLYFDFELTDKQFESRYSASNVGHHNFDQHFMRIEINPDLDLPEGQDFEDHFYQCLERTIIEQNAKVLIIDNLTYLKNETEQAKDALPLMKHLKALKSKYGLSILVLAHTPKRDMSKPISRNDLSGSKMLINFCDSAFAIGESIKDPNLRYLKQIKQRNTEQVYGGDNICICQINKPLNFLQFELLSQGNEQHHLKETSEKNNNELQQKIMELNQNGLSFRQIGEHLGVSHMKVCRVLKNAGL